MNSTRSLRQSPSAALEGIRKESEHYLGGIGDILKTESHPQKIDQPFDEKCEDRHHAAGDDSRYARIRADDVEKAVEHTRHDQQSVANAPA